MGIAHRDTATKRPNEENIMTAEWFYQVGPVTASQLKQLANNGMVERETLIKKGDGSWVKAIKVRGLFDSPTPDGAKGVPVQPITDYTKAIELEPKAAVAYISRGIGYLVGKQYGKAILNFSRAIEIAPKSAEAYYNRGEANQNLHQYDKAIADCNKAIEIDPKEAVAYYNRGGVYEELKQYDKAITDYTRAIKINPKWHGAYITRGLAYEKLNQYDKAIADYTKAIEIDPKWVMANYKDLYTQHGPK